MKTAYAYARVSSKEQEEKKNSIPEQFYRIDNFSNSEGIVITKKFQDSSSAFHDTNRDDFTKMIELAVIERPNYIILDDSSRFARTRQVAIDTKNKLRTYGIEILYASEPNIDTKTIAGFWLEGIQELKNEATSREIAFNVTRGMNRNLKNRDEETGWCYKNGGKPPYGYIANQLYKRKKFKRKTHY